MVLADLTLLILGYNLYLFLACLSKSSISWSIFTKKGYNSLVLVVCKHNLLYWEKIWKSGPKVRPTIMKNWIFDEKVHRIRKTSQNFFSFFRKMLKKWFICAFPEIEKISQNLGPKLGQKLWKIESLMKRCIRSANPHRTVFRFFARYYDAKKNDL